MDERHLEPEHAPPRRGVDQLGSGLCEMCESSREVADLVGDMVHSRTPLREKAADRRVVAERAQQLEPALADPDGGGLDALLLDARALLQARAEQPPVRLESRIQIGDGEADVVDRTEAFHHSIVCERLPLAMSRMQAPILMLVLMAGLLAGCGGSGGGTTSSSSNGEASKSGTQVLSDATRAATGASSFHASGHVSSSGTSVTLDLTIAKGKGAKGSMSTGGASFDLVEVGNTVYIKGSDAFYKKFGGAAAAQLLHGKWVKGSASTGQLAPLADLTDPQALFQEVAKNHGKLVNDGETTYAGQKVVEIKKASSGDILYVAATGTPYPVALVGGKGDKGDTVTLDKWNQSVSISPPSGAIDLSTLTG
jgi:hypothetical protein